MLEFGRAVRVCEFIVGWDQGSAGSPCVMPEIGVPTISIDSQPLGLFADSFLIRSLGLLRIDDGVT